ncbi:MAG: tRNA (guanosine(37)-N1)-methyltransferase TrmD [Mailhella sp.]|nr:tRNA (guanosine(37)-N1)-methyltransferase TrmD [Mailhella sp.]
MRYHVVTLFPEWFDSPMKTGLMGKAAAGGTVEIETVNPRDFAPDARHTVDDVPYGGGPGMVLMPGPLASALESIANPGIILALTPSGEPFSQDLACELAKEKDITLLCGRYEGFDERIFELFPIRRVSVCDAVLNGGEVGAMAIIEATARLQPGFMGKTESGEEESFSDGLLEYPHYTRPVEFNGLLVPDVLRGGDHARIAEWRRNASLANTSRFRPDLLASAPLSARDRAFLRENKKKSFEKNIYFALLHFPVRLKGNFSGTSSLTNLDIHDIARISRTYGIGAFFAVTPMQEQMSLLEEMLRHWIEGCGKDSNPDRAEALSLVRPAKSLEDTVQVLQDETGKKPLLIATSAEAETDRKGRERRVAVPFAEVSRRAAEGPVLILLGTARGLAPEAMALCDAILPPIRWIGDYNHLPVRAAAAIILDRIIGG